MEQAYDGLHVEVIQDTSGFATVYWWNQANEDNQMHIIVTNVTAGTQNQFESQHEVRVFYLPMHLIDCETYTVKVIGKTTHREGEVTFWADRNQVTVEQSTRTTAAFRWPAQLGQCVNITLEEHRIKQDVSTYECDLSHLTMGRQYKVTIRGFDKELITIFRAEFTRNEMETLLGKAKTYVGDGQFLSCEVFYRNKPNAYFEDCYNNHNGTMNVRLKDNGGDQASVINGQISGLFFMANVDFSTGEPFGSSPFGRKRVIYPAITLFHRDANLYFVDFYCMYEKIHYVTLVLTQPFSDVDHFCQRKKLIKLDNENRYSIRKISHCRIVNSLKMSRSLAVVPQPPGVYQSTAIVRCVICPKTYVSLAHLCINQRIKDSTEYSEHSP